jgi:O-antigen ligase
VWLVAILIVATLFLRSVNGWLLLTLGVLLVILARVSPTRWWLLAVLAVIPAYLAGRAGGLWTGDQIGQLAALIHPDRGQSLLYRFLNENIVLAHIHGHEWFGYGRQPAALSDYRGGHITPDSLWIIVLTYFGVAGLISWVACLVVPVLVFLRTMPAERWLDAETGAVAGLAVVLVLSSIDHLVNAMINPIFMVIAGGLASLIRPISVHSTAQSSGGR